MWMVQSKITHAGSQKWNRTEHLLEPISDHFRNFFLNILHTFFLNISSDNPGSCYSTHTSIIEGYLCCLRTKSMELKLSLFNPVLPSKHNATLQLVLTKIQTLAEVIFNEHQTKKLILDHKTRQNTS